MSLKEVERREEILLDNPLLFSLDDRFQLEDKQLELTNVTEGEKPSILSCSYHSPSHDLQDKLVGKEKFPIKLELVSTESSLLLIQVDTNWRSAVTETNIILYTSRIRRISRSVLRN